MQLVISDREGNILVNQGDMLLEEEAIAQKLRNNTERAGLTLSLIHIFVFTAYE